MYFYMCSSVLVYCIQLAYNLHNAHYYTYTYMSTGVQLTSCGIAVSVNARPHSFSRLVSCAFLRITTLAVFGDVERVVVRTVAISRVATALHSECVRLASYKLNDWYEFVVDPPSDSPRLAI